MLPSVCCIDCECEKSTKNQQSLKKDEALSITLLTIAWCVSTQLSKKILNNNNNEKYMHDVFVFVNIIHAHNK